MHKSSFSISFPVHYRRVTQLLPPSGYILTLSYLDSVFVFFEFLCFLFGFWFFVFCLFFLKTLVPFFFDFLAFSFLISSSRFVWYFVKPPHTQLSQALLVTWSRLNTYFFFFFFFLFSYLVLFSNFIVFILVFSFLWCNFVWFFGTFRWCFLLDPTSICITLHQTSHGGFFWVNFLFFVWFFSFSFFLFVFVEEGPRRRR